MLSHTPVGTYTLRAGFAGRLYTAGPYTILYDGHGKVARVAEKDSNGNITHQRSSPRITITGRAR